MIRAKLNEYVIFARKCYGYIAPERILFALSIVLSLMAIGAESLGLLLLGPVMETLAGKQLFGEVPLLGNVSTWFTGIDPNTRLMILAAAMLTVAVVRNALQVAVGVVNVTVPLRVSKRLQLQAYRALVDAKLGYYQSRNVGEIANFVSSYPARISALLTELSGLAGHLVLMVTYLFLMVLVSWKLTAIALVYVVACTLAMRYYTSGPLVRAGREMTEAGEALTRVSFQTVHGIKLIHLMVAGKLMLDAFRAGVEKVQRASRRHAFVAAAVQPVFSTSASLLVASMLFGVGLIGLGADQTLVATVFMFLFLLQRLMGPASALNQACVNILVNLEILDRYKEYLIAAQENVEQSGDQPFDAINSEIAFDRVNFAYDDSDTNVLEDVSFKIGKGEMVALVGPSGAGKSTLINMVTRLYDPNSGEITVDGRPLRSLVVDQWRSKLSVVSQDVIIFNDSIRANLCFGQPESISDERLREVARLAACEDFIADMPDGMETQLGERGVRLSGGQQQRIAIARAIVNDPELLILDEATSNLDSETERAIQTAVETLGKTRTLIVIAHRLSTVRQADKIVVLDKGRIVETGRHDELMTGDGRYRRLFEMQRLDLV